MSQDLSPHESLLPVRGLLGTWEGVGRGDYPTIEPFTYSEEVVFGHVGKPFLTYRQRTWHPRTGAPMHAEVGYLRVLDGARLELVLAHPTGIVEVEEGALDGGTLTLTTTSVGRSSTAKDVRALRREFRLDGDQLDYDVWMTHAQTPETHHLHAELRRVR